MSRAEMLSMNVPESEYRLQVSVNAVVPKNNDY